MKRLVSIILTLALTAAMLFSLCSCEKAEDDIYICNWGEYISDGSDGTFDVLEGFKEYYFEVTGRTINIHYTTFPSNEELYAKMSAGGTFYDVVCPSDYMIARFIDEGLVQKLNLEEVCAKYNTECFYKYITDDFRGLYYDPTDEYSVPYGYSRVGIIYDKTKVDPEDLTGYEIMWNEKYKGQILQFNNSRDGFATAQYLLGYDINSTDLSEWDKAYEALLEQKPLVQSYVMDEIFNKMEAGEAAIAAFYAGDYFLMKSINDNLEFYYPDPTNVFVDSWCIPADSKNPEIGALFINYMLTEEPAIANAVYLNYGWPNSLVYESEEYKEIIGEERYSVLYPEGFVFKDELNKNGYRNLDTQTLEYIASLWEKLKISGGLPSNIYWTAGIIAAVIIAGFVASIVTKSKRKKYY